MLSWSYFKPVPVLIMHLFLFSRHHQHVFLSRAYLCRRLLVHATVMVGGRIDYRPKEGLRVLVLSRGPDIDFTGCSPSECLVYLGNASGHPS